MCRGPCGRGECASHALKTWSGSHLMWSNGMRYSPPLSDLLAFLIGKVKPHYTSGNATAPDIRVFHVILIYVEFKMGTVRLLKPMKR